MTIPTLGKECEFRPQHICSLTLDRIVLIKLAPTWRIIQVNKLLMTMVRFRPLRIGLWDPFQMAIHGI